MEKKISIIVPVYNVQNELKRCVRSICLQTYKELEIILVNDGSTDASWEIMKELAEEDQRIIIMNKENGGVTSARLQGVAAATGDYIGFVDGDDEIETTMYEFLLGNAIKYKADISHCGYQMIFADGRVNFFYNTGKLVEQDRTAGIKDLLEGIFVEPGLCNKLFAKNLLHNLCKKNLMKNDIRINEDLLMNYYLFNMANKSVYEDKCPYHYMVRMTSASRQKMNYHKIYDPIRVKKIILKECEKGMKRDAEKALLNTCIYTYCGLTIERNKYESDKKAIRHEIKEHINSIDMLPRRTKFLGKMIVKFHRAIDMGYPLYAKWIQKKIYE